MIRITVYAGPSDYSDNYEPTTTVRTVAEMDVSETLRQIGLEWRQADYFPTRQTVITFDPVPDKDEKVEVRALVREAAAKLEKTGLL